MVVSFTEVLEHADGVDARLVASDGDEAVPAVHRLHQRRLRHAVADADGRFFFALLTQQPPACFTARLGLALRVRVRALPVGHEVLAGLRVQRVAVLACHVTKRLLV